MTIPKPAAPAANLHTAASPGGNALEMDLRLSHDDAARRAFMVAFKKKVNIDLQQSLRRLYDDRIAPALRKKRGRALNDRSKDDRKAVKAALQGEPLYRSWAALTYISQSMLWDCVEDVLSHDLPRLQRAAEHYFDRPVKAGSLRLNAGLKVPRNIAATEIHRQPGGFCFENHPRDISAGARYNGGGLIYAEGRGRNAKAGKSGAEFVWDLIRARWPGFRPTRILEVGCGTGRNTPSYARLFPDAEIHAMDCAPGLLRWAHAFAESKGLPVRFAQMDAAAMDYADESFDLIVSHIVGHETTTRGLPRMIKECWRLLKPGGVALHVDVPTQPGHLTLLDQALNDWQVRYNGEPFWMGWADADVKAHMRAAGYAEADMLAEHVSREEGGFWFCHGGRKPLPSTTARRAA